MKLELSPLPDEADAGLVSIHGELTQALGNFQKAAAKVEADFQRGPVARQVEIEHQQQAAQAELDRIAKLLQRERETFEQRKREVRRIVPPTDQRLQRFVEVRTVLRSLPDDRRTATLQQARGRQDDIVLHALLDGSAVLCGMGQRDYDAACEQARQALHADQLAEVDQDLAAAAEIARQLEQVLDFINSYRTVEDIADAV